MALIGHRWALGVLGVAGVLFACNQIIGVEDVTPKIVGQRLDGATSGGPGDDDDVIGPPNGDDGSTPDTPRPYIALGYDHGCVKMLDGTVRCWGENFNGQVGDGTQIDGSASPQDVLRPKTIPGITDAVALAAGLDHTCVVHKTGTVSCWGEGASGQLGYGGTDSTSTPVDVKGVTDAIAVGAGSSTTCIVHKDATASCWGQNLAGGLGDGTTTDSNVPVAVKTLTNIIQIAPSTNHTCAVLSNGQVWCWGGGSDGQLGTGSLDDTTKPTQLTALSDMAQVAVASRFSCARGKSGSVFCWGRNESGQLGNGSPTTSPNPSPIAVAITDAIWIWAGTNHACAVKKAGDVVCWGDDSSGQLGNGILDASYPGSPVPTAALTIKTGRTVFTAGERTCTVTSDNKAFCWGFNEHGELGNGSNQTTPNATPISDFN
jgi:alpha-tubulin suppressor-like RCC1 family protein